ncbi:MAG: hypothetical protein IPL52_07810 [Flavobacteriales bacterium]|nr:hypothetical protein [Flavobacteriales bacterium]
MHTVFFARTLLSTAVLALALVPRASSAQWTAAAPDPASSLSLELDPMPFALGGYSFSVRYADRHLTHWSAMASVFSSDFPNGMLSSANKEAGWNDLHFRPSHALFVDYDFSGTGRGFFAGPSVFLYNNEVTHGPTGELRTFTSIYPNVRLGYTWFPFKKAGLYLSPWVNLGRETILGDQAESEAPDYVMADIKYIAALHMGYRCSF